MLSKADYLANPLVFNMLRRLLFYLLFFPFFSLGSDAIIVDLHHNNHTMAKIIKKAVSKKEPFTVGQSITWYTSETDGRLNWTGRHFGTVVKVCPVNLRVEDVLGNTWSVSKEEATAS